MLRERDHNKLEIGKYGGKKVLSILLECLFGKYEFILAWQFDNKKQFEKQKRNNLNIM